VSAVVVSWNTRPLLEACLESLHQHGGRRPLEAIVVDNGSTDGTVPMVRERWPAVSLIANQDNLGFSRANNQGIRASSGEWLLLLNSDARLTPGCLDRMVELLEARPRAAAVGPRLVYGDGRWQRWTAGRFPSLRAAVNHYLFLDRVSAAVPFFEGLYLGRDLRDARPVDWVSGACLLLRREALQEVGLLDERLFMYMEDVDLCQRLSAADWEVWYCPQATAIHLMGGSVQTEVALEHSAALRALNRYFAARHGPWALAALRAAQAVGFALRAGSCLVAATVARSERHYAQACAHWTHLKITLEVPFGR
jgi:hypothetical protein